MTSFYQTKTGNHVVRNFKVMLDPKMHLILYSD